MNDLVQAILKIAADEPKQIGTYKMIVMGGSPEYAINPEYAEKPFYGIRRVGLTRIKRDVLQVLLPVLGELMWINVSPEDISPSNILIN